MPGDDRTGLLIVGGSDAGVMAGLWARRTDPNRPVAVLVRDGYANFNICGLRLLVSRGWRPEPAGLRSGSR
jgi:NADPH-dependent 2,4-dienoyl-CoA reductase/sulfur reductase-like enzyme